MALPTWLARFNRVVTNRVARPLARWMPGYGVIVHTGRRTGREYRTPVNVFRRSGGYVIALTYGTGSQWVQNILAAEGCRIQTRGRVESLADPVIVHDPHRTAVPFFVRLFLSVLGVSDFLQLSVQPPRS